MGLMQVRPPTAAMMAERHRRIVAEADALPPRPRRPTTGL
jgi:hypothetical protein